jgi:hypothetical protein
VGKPSPVISSSFHYSPQVRLDLLVLANHSSSDPSPSPCRNLAGIFSALLPRRARGISARISKLLGVSLYFKSSELQKFIENHRKFRKIPNQFYWNT